MLVAIRISFRLFL